MADLAHDASGPASSEPAGIALQQANRPASSDKEKLRVFISYSRDDLDFADQLADALNACGFKCLIDRHGISGGEDWKRRLGNLVTEADTVVFVLSPSSARSPICDWEVEEAARLNKRILPIVCRPLESVKPPPRLQKLDYSFFYKEPKVSGSGFGNGLAKLIAALNTDFDWLREHTRYLQRAIEWDTGGRPANRLLSGDDIAEAKAWVARRPKGAPEPTALQLDFIRASEEEAAARLSEQRKQLDAMAAAQAEREKALHDREEALKQAADAQLQAADAQRRRARIRNIGLVAVSGLAAVAVLFAWTANQQRQQADELLARGMWVILSQPEMKSKPTKEVFALLQAGADYGNALSMGMLGSLYADGAGVEKDYAKAREWYEKAAAKDRVLAALAMNNLGVLYENGQGVPQDFVKAREWYEKAAAKDYAPAMHNLGMLYDNGQGLVQDYAKAREWFEKAADKGDVYAKTALEQLPIHEAKATGRYPEALRLQEAFAAKTEADETKRDGKPGEETAEQLSQITWYALFAREFPKALAVADRAHALFPDHLLIESNRAHALMFTEHAVEGKALYLAYKGKSIKGSKLWERAIADDFAKFQKAGLTHPMMADIEKELGISR